MHIIHSIKVISGQTWEFKLDSFRLLATECPPVPRPGRPLPPHPPLQRQQGRHRNGLQPCPTLSLQARGSRRPLRKGKQQDRGVSTISWLETRRMIADILTKALPKALFVPHASIIEGPI